MSLSSKKITSQEKRSPLSIGVSAGLGVGLLGALALALRFGWKNPRRCPLSDAISPAIFATRMMDTSSGEIVYHTSGNGEPLLFLHGVFPGASSFEWSKIYPHFAQHHLVLVPDLIGFGESQRPRPAITAEAQVRSLAEFLEATTLDRPATIIASGLSANLALLLAARYPHHVTRLLLWMPLLSLQKTFSGGYYHHLSWFPALARIVYGRQLSTEASIKQWLLRSGFSTENASLEEALTVLTSTAQQYGAEHAFLAQSSRSFWQKIPTRITTMNIPITLLVAQESERQTAEAIISLRPCATRFSINEVETVSSLAPLADPQPLITSILHELSQAKVTGDRLQVTADIT